MSASRPSSVSAERPSPWRHPLLALGDRIALRLPPGQRRAGWWETRLWLSVSPIAYLGLRVIGRRRVARLGRFGVVVNDPAIGRAILVDPARFRTVGPGTHGELIDQVLGPNALLNMDGADHERLRRTLGPLLAPNAAAGIVEASATEPIEAAVEELRVGRPVDLVRLTRIMTGTDDVHAPRRAAAGRMATTHTSRHTGWASSSLAMTVRAIRRGPRPDDLARARTLDRLARRTRPRGLGDEQPGSWAGFASSGSGSRMPERSSP